MLRKISSRELSAYWKGEFAYVLYYSRLGYLKSLCLHVDIRKSLCTIFLDRASIDQT